MFLLTAGMPRALSLLHKECELTSSFSEGSSAPERARAYSLHDAIGSDFILELDREDCKN